jgi:class 3 adenylate cyclase
MAATFGEEAVAQPFDALTRGMTQPRPFTLAFGPVALEEAFEQEYRHQPRAYYRMLGLAVLGFLLIISAVGLVVTYSVNREGIQLFLWSALIPLTAVATACLHLPALAGAQRTVVVAYVVSVGIACALYPAVRGDRFIAETYAFSYLSFVLLLALAFGRFAPRQAILLAVGLIGLYSAIAAWRLGPQVVANHLPLLLGAAAIGFAVGYLMERTVRLLFAARRHAEEREARLAESELQLREAQARSEELIHSMIPASIAARLRDEGGTIADGVVECTVVFADLVGFTPLAREMGPRALVRVLNELFSEFDALCERLGLEKIKTIGDAYMAAAGVPVYVEDHAARAANLALAMLGVVQRYAEAEGVALRVRVGIHSGPVIAGVIGTRRLAYDLWGETVNVASRMESHGAPGRIHVSEDAALLLKRSHALEERGVTELKGQGTMRTYWLLGATAPQATRRAAGALEPSRED